MPATLRLTAWNGAHVADGSPIKVLIRRPVASVRMTSRNPAPGSRLDSANGYASAYEAEKWHYHGLAESEGERADRAEKQVEELTMWVKRLAHSLRNAKPDSKLHGAAMDYLSRKGLISVEDILR